MSLIGMQAPAWSANAYVNGDVKTVSSTDFEGGWYVLYFYPLDFTVACSTEIRGFEMLMDAFGSDEVAVIGVSTDSLNCHQAWFADRDTFPQEITHPVLADTNHLVSRTYDVLNGVAGIAFRATVIVDDKGVLRSISVNDTDVARSPAEVLQTVQAFQAGGTSGADGHRGDDLVLTHQSGGPGQVDPPFSAPRSPSS